MSLCRRADGQHPRRRHHRTEWAAYGELVPLD